MRVGSDRNPEAILVHHAFLLAFLLVEADDPAALLVLLVAGTMAMPRLAYAANTRRILSPGCVFPKYMPTLTTMSTLPEIAKNIPAGSGSTATRGAR
ncbi:hypothetical protein [Streptomyces sp. NPDC057545]|uniref:hypothetical protein n=1 Tax=Streptomyces sp. NPDC057545 TaxID=3346164 RepID=UPI0036A82CD5